MIKKYQLNQSAFFCVRIEDEGRKDQTTPLSFQANKKI